MTSLRQLKICFVAGTLGQGGAERQLFYMLRTLLDQGAIPRVLSFGQGEYWEAPLRRLGVRVISLGHVRSKLGRLWRIISELHRDPPSIVQSQHFFTNAYTSIAARVLRRCGIGALRSNGQMETQDCGRVGGTLNLSLPRILAANSRAALAYAYERGIPPSRLFYLSNVIDVDQWQPGPRSRGEPLTLVAVGRLVQVKRFDRFLRLVAHLKRDLKCEIRALIIGTGPLRSELEIQARDLGLLPNVVRFVGATSELAPLYRAADIFVITSEHEGTPNAALEAMASTLPVVAAAVGGLPELIQHGINGLLFEPSNETGLQRAVTQLATDEPLRRLLGQNARKHVAAQYSLQALPRGLQDLYERALAQGHGRSERVTRSS